ncbi:PAS-domain containing protein [Pontixanthobacter aestiaquae]|uniref:histidine kinase n=1 Tax=Pontixanthobacter aestiaquae TaxID=1509367 RepID=A0A844Z8V8_9SPHN|nr:PAS domain-containing sensor histidine kinase [Pontixanthobacter aestiaquae]MDN3645610.1 PAS-domain containing protein [Pontixanthobacter aestiaquae]MXO83393.1 histidine kinase [Pontixanthobacter aestiaquae]
MQISPTALIIIGLLLAAWMVAAAWMMIAAGGKARGAEGSRKAARRMARMIDEAPAIPLVVRTDGRIEGSDRLAGWLGLDTLPEYLSELDGGQTGDHGKGLSADQLKELTENVRRSQKTAAPFRMALTPPGSQRSLAVRGVLADPQVSPGGAALVWIFDFSESESELSRLREEAARAKGDFGALVGIIEAAPMPMWFRGPDAKLQLVNKAYVDAIGAVDADSAVIKQQELIESIDGLTAAQVAGQAFEKKMPIERIVTATINGQRRALRVSDLPLGKEGVAGYAVDIEEMEEQGRQFRAFRDAQRSMLDQLSIGVGQFDADRKLTFANQPFRRVFALNSGVVSQGIDFERLLQNARENGRTPEVRDFPEWRTEHTEWFNAGETQEEAWPLSDGTHLRIVAQPMPDGGLVIVAEDRTEQLALSATRDTLLRTRTATFDSLFEALAVFAPDGHLQLWNRSFAGTWGLEPELLDAHPSAEELLEAIAPNLARSKQAKGIGEVIRAATLDRKEQGGRIALADGRTLEFAGIPLPDGNGLLTVLDVTANEQAEAALRERNKALEAADEVKTQFLSNMSYEFRTPLTSIGGFAELLQAGVAGDLSDQGKEYVEAIIESVGRLTDQVENVLDLSQSEAGLLPLNKKRLDLMPFVTDVVRSREQVISDGGITLDLRGSKASGKIEADKRQLGRAIGQLLDNAIAATPSGGKILVDLSKQKGVAQIVISDNGTGMSKDELKRAMAGQNDTKKQGLGIPLARQLVESHGGTLEIHSRQGEGTAAVIQLP